MSERNALTIGRVMRMVEVECRRAEAVQVSLRVILYQSISQSDHTVVRQFCTSRELIDYRTDYRNIKAAAETAKRGLRRWFHGRQRDNGGGRQGFQQEVDNLRTLSVDDRNALFAFVNSGGNGTVEATYR